MFTTMSQSLPAEYFDHVYRANADPWNFAASPYEAAKYAATLAVLPRARYGRALEIGCSIGVFTAQLAGRCDALLSLDIAEAALAQARARCAHLPNVRFERRGVPAEFPTAEGPWDLVVVAEVGYYLDLEDLHRLRAQAIASLAPGGELLLVHWTPLVHDYPLTGDQVHETFHARAGEDGELSHLHDAREERYRLDLFRRR